MAKHKDIQVSLSGGGSGHGIKALMDKTTDVAMASRDMKPAEVENVQQRALLQASNGAVLQTVAKNPNAIGYVGLGYITKDIKGLSISGKVASAETALSRAWPLARDLYLFTNGQPAGDVKTLIDYALSPEGQVSVKEVGFVPLPAKK